MAVVILNHNATYGQLYSQLASFEAVQQLYTRQLASYKMAYFSGRGCGFMSYYVQMCFRETNQLSISYIYAHKRVGYQLYSQLVIYLHSYSQLFIAVATHICYASGYKYFTWQLQSTNELLLHYQQILLLQTGPSVGFCSIRLTHLTQRKSDPTN